MLSNRRCGNEAAPAASSNGRSSPLNEYLPVVAGEHVAEQKRRGDDEALDGDGARQESRPIRSGRVTDAQLERAAPRLHEPGDRARARQERRAGSREYDVHAHRYDLASTEVLH